MELLWHVQSNYLVGDAWDTTIVWRPTARYTKNVAFTIQKCSGALADQTRTRTATNPTPDNETAESSTTELNYTLQLCR